MIIYLVRHGSAEAGADDAARRLSPRGREEVEAVARWVAAARIEVAEIRHSGLARARESAEILAARLAPPRGVREVGGLRPNDDPRPVRTELAAARDPVMLVGHLPQLARLASLLLAGDPTAVPIRFAPGAVACLAREDDDGWALDWLVTPALAGPGRPA